MKPASSRLRGDTGTPPNTLDAERDDRRRHDPPRPAARSGEGDELQRRKAAAYEHERRVARLLGGTPRPGSGALGLPGDVATEGLLVSCKRTEQKSLTLPLAEIEKITLEAEAEGRTPAVALELAGVDGAERDWIMVPARVIAAWLASLR